MKAFIFIAIIAIANGVIDTNYRTKKYIPKMPKLDPLTEIDKEEASPYIVGGRVASPHAWPWQVALYIDDRYFCGGSLISDRWVMSAAHCTDGAKSIIVQLGAHNRSANEITQVTFESRYIITHNGYNPRLIDNDIGLVKLPRAVSFTNSIQPVNLPCGKSDLGAGVNLTPTGWGLTSDATFAQLSDVLRQVNVPTITNNECARTYGNAAVPDGKICTSGRGGKGTCNGDSGGPLNYAILGGYEVRGIVSYGSTKGCTKGYPDAYTRVTHYCAWIQFQTGGV